MVPIKKYFIQFFAILFFLSLFLCDQGFAAPSIGSISGTLSNGSTLTITGSGFGPKSPAAPLLWFDCESGIASASFDQLTPSQSTAAYNTKCRTTIRGEAQVHSQSAKYLTGAHYAGGGGITVSGLSGYNVAAFKNFGMALSKSFVSFHYKVDTNFASTFNIGSVFTNYKMLTYQGNNYSLYAQPYGYWQNYGTLSGNWQSPGWTAVSSVNILSVNNDSGLEYGGSWTHIPGIWSKLEFEAVHATSNNQASFKFYHDGVKVHDYSGYNDSFQVYGIGIGGYLTPNNLSHEWRYFDDIYIDNTWARVVIGDASTWSDSITSVRELQIPSAWSATSITVTVNKGSLGSLSSNVFLYVIDENGNVNANGYPLLCPDCPKSIKAD